MQRTPDQTEGFISRQRARLARPPGGVDSQSVVALISRLALLGFSVWVLWYLAPGQYDAVMVSGISLVGLAVALAELAETRGLPRPTTAALRSVSVTLLVLAPATILVWTAVTVGVFAVPMAVMVGYSIAAQSWLDIPLGYNREKEDEKKSDPQTEDFSRPHSSRGSGHPRSDRVHGRGR